MSAIKQDRIAYKTIYEICSPYVFSIIKRYITDANDYKDVLQETFARVFLSLNTFDESKGNFKYWLRKIVINQSIQHLRKYKKLSMVLPLNDWDEPQENLENLMTGLTKTDIEGLLSKMPLGYARIFMMYAIDEFTHKEIAELLDITAETSRSQFFRARTWIKNNIVNNNTNLLKNGL